MPINTDTLDLTQPLAGQDIAPSEPLANPVLSKDRLKQIGELFKGARAAEAGATAPPVATPNAPAAAPPASPATPGAPRTHGEPIAKTLQGDSGTPVTDAPGTPRSDSVTEHPTALDPATLMSPRSREMFKRLEASRDEQKAARVKLEQTLAERDTALKTRDEELARLRAVPVPEDLESMRTAAQRAADLEASNKDLLARVEALDFEHSPRFQAWWKEETGKNIKLAQRVVAPEHRETIARLLMEQPGVERSAALAKVLEGVDEASRLVVAGALKDVEAAKIKREEALAEGPANLHKLRAHEQAQRDQERRAAGARQAAITQAALARAETLDAFKPIEGDAEHNEQILVRKEFIKAAVAGQLDEDVAVALPGLAFEALHLQGKVVPALRAELDKANAIIKQLQAASPAPQGGGSAQQTASTTKPGAQGKFLEAVRRAQAGG